MGIQKYVFYSIHNCDKHPEVPLMEIKFCIEKFLRDSGLNHVIIRLCGFMQGLIGQYAVPILEEKSVWGTDAPTRIAYMDTQDIARLTFIAIRNDKLNGKLLTFAGPRAWTTQEVITLCERLAGQDANVTTVPVSILRLTFLSGQMMLLTDSHFQRSLPAILYFLFRWQRHTIFLGLIQKT
ncbi:hypothetical protein GLYMA_06G001032v4 [Glycine max]|nr:hypothetical protein GYH30_013630 [Glycine max]KRH51337.2 hypothetical protein GLYMA_06G001032v4 [Glycine max]